MQNMCACCMVGENKQITTYNITNQYINTITNQYNYTALGVHKEHNIITNQYNYTAASLGECSDTTYNIHMWRLTASEGECINTTYNTHVVLKLHVKGSAATPLTTYTCGVKTASEGECSDTTYNIHMWH